MSLAVDVIYQTLNPVVFDATNRTGCLDGTRTNLIQTITEWALDSTQPQNVLWLHGLAGSGKSALSTTIANHLRDKGRLGAFIFYDRDDSERSNPSNVIRTIVYQLCSYNASIQAAISAVLQKFSDIHLSPIRTQFLHLLVDALRADGAVDATTPIVVVFDAMDECGNPDSRESLLEVISELWSQLPLSIRLFVTSRCENGIRGALEGQEHVLAMELNTDSAANNNDISFYLRKQLHRVRNKTKSLQNLGGWPSDGDISKLTQRASGLFVWASTASKFVDGPYPRIRMNKLLDGDGQLGPERALDALYTTALESIERWEDAHFLSNFRVVMGTLLVARRPLSHTAIDALLRLNDATPCIDTVSYMGCVLQQAPTVRLLHPSFADFLFDRSRCSREIWWFEHHKLDQYLAEKSLAYLNTVLKRNICSIKLSSLPVDEVIPESVAYACLFWIDHVCSIANIQDTLSLQLVLERRHTFLYRKLLHWLEVMSFLKNNSLTLALDVICNNVVIDLYIISLQLRRSSRYRNPTRVRACHRNCLRYGNRI